MSYQANLQTSFRAISGTTRSFNEDAMAAMAVELGGTPPADINGRMIAWLQLRLGSSVTDLNGLWAEFRAAEPDALFDPLGIVTSGLLAEWRFDEGEGSTLTDYTGNGHGGTLGADSAAPTWSATGLTFDGSDDLVTCDTAGIAGAAARTVIAVVNTSANLGFGWDGGVPPFFDEWSVFAAAGPVLRLDVAGVGHTSALSIPAAWCFIALTQSGANTDTAIMYVDGDSEAVTADAVVATEGNFIFGKAPSTTFRAFDCAYGLIYNRALSANEIIQNRSALATILAGRGITLP